jgi:hypothetical protein
MTNENEGAPPPPTFDSKVDTMQQILLQAVTDEMDRRHHRANVAWETLRPYERRILHEAAVMGYVMGHTGGPVPSDTDIIRMVITHCDSNADLYPYIAAACTGRRRRITRKRLHPGETL